MSPVSPCDLHIACCGTCLDARGIATGEHVPREVSLGLKRGDDLIRQEHGNLAALN